MSMSIQNQGFETKCSVGKSKIKRCEVILLCSSIRNLIVFLHAKVVQNRKERLKKGASLERAKLKNVANKDNVAKGKCENEWWKRI